MQYTNIIIVLSIFMFTLCGCSSAKTCHINETFIIPVKADIALDGGIIRFSIIEYSKVDIREIIEEHNFFLTPDVIVDSDSDLTPNTLYRKEFLDGEVGGGLDKPMNASDREEVIFLLEKYQLQHKYQRGLFDSLIAVQTHYDVAIDDKRGMDEVLNLVTSVSDDALMLSEMILERLR